jgi:hypothetical protein
VSRSPGSNADVPFGAGPDRRDDVVMWRRYGSSAPGTSPVMRRFAYGREPRLSDGARDAIVIRVDASRSLSRLANPLLATMSSSALAELREMQRRQRDR